SDVMPPDRSSPRSASSSPTRPCQARSPSGSYGGHSPHEPSLDRRAGESEVIPGGGVAHGHEAEVLLWIDTHRVEEAAAPAEVLPIDTAVTGIAVPAEPSEPDVELASTGGGLLHR